MSFGALIALGIAILVFIVVVILLAVKVHYWGPNEEKHRGDRG